MTLQGKNSQRLTVLSAYRVCDQAPLPTSINTGPGTDKARTAHTQQLQVYREDGLPNARPRHLFLQDLRALIQEKFAEPGHELLIGIDANEDWSDGVNKHGVSASSFQAVMASCGMHDVIAHCNNQAPSPSTIQGKTKVIDYILCSSGVLPHIRHATILPRNETFQSDHPALTVSIDATSLLGDPKAVAQQTGGRRLKCKIKKSVDKYTSTLKDLLAKNHIHSRVQALKAVPKRQWTEQDNIKYEHLDTKITQLMLTAEKRCSKGRQASHLWSPALADAGSKYSYWKLYQRSTRTECNVSQQSLVSIQKRAKILDHPPMTYSAAKANARAAYKHLEHVRRNDAHYRSRHLDQVAFATSGNDDPAGVFSKAVQQLKLAEEWKRRYKKCQVLCGKGTRAGLTHILVPTNPEEDPNNSCQSWTAVRDQDIMERRILQQNERHFSQADTTPFGSDPLRSALGCTSTNDTCHEILAGSYLTDDPMVEVQQYLNWCKRPENVPPINPTISSAAFRKTFQNLKESKASSPSGRHVGHYKAAAEDEELTQLHCDMMSLPFAHGFSPSRWSRVTDVMLEKAAGMPRLHRLRIIQLIEADFNQALLISFTRPMTKNVVDLGLVHPGQWATKEQQCSSAVLHKVLTLEHCRISKRSIAWMENDATGCFDRIIPVLALLNCQRYGITAAACETLGKTWQNLKHNIRTSHGDSLGLYPNGNDVPQFGAGQGSCLAPLLWLSINTILLQILDQLPERVVLKDPASGICHHHHTGNSYVDDTSLMTTLPDDDTPHANAKVVARALADSMAHLGQKAERSLFASGGALQLTKCLWFCITWQWTDHGDARISTIDETPCSMMLTHGRGTDPSPIERLPPEESTKTLGVYIAPDGNQKKQFEVLVEKAKKFETYANSNSTEPVDAYLLQTSFFHPSISFPVGVASLSQKQLKSIEAKYLTPILQKMGFRSTLSKAIAFGPKNLGGLDIIPLTLAHDIEHLKMLCGHLRANDSTTTVLRTTMNAFQLASGFCEPFLSLPFCKKQSWHEKGWLHSCWAACHRHKIKIESQHTWAPKLLRTHDKSLMEHLINTSLFAPWELAKINKMRIFLKVTTISDVATAAGTHLDPRRYQDSPPTPVEHSEFVWPLQIDPKYWHLWRRALRTLVHGRDDLRLIVPLGEWTSQPRQEFHWFVRANGQSLVHKQPAHPAVVHFKKPRHHNSRSTLREFRTVSRPYVPDDPDETFLYADVETRGATLLLRGTSKIPAAEQTPASFPALDTATSHLFPHEPIAQSVWDALARHATSKSLHAEIGSTAGTSPQEFRWKLWAEEDTTENSDTAVIQATGSPPCTSTETSTERGTLLGLVAVLHCIAKIELLAANIQPVHLHPLGWKTLTYVQFDAPSKGFNALCRPNSDIAKHAQNLLASLTTTFAPADDTNAVILDEPPTNQPVVNIPPTVDDYFQDIGYVITIDGATCGYFPEDDVRRRSTTPPLHRYLEKWCHLPQSSIELVSWDALALAVDKYEIALLLPAIRWISNAWPIGLQLTKLRLPLSLCPFCSQPEDIPHLFTCEDTAASAQRAKARKVLRRALKNVKDHSRWTHAVDKVLAALAPPGSTHAPDPDPDPDPLLSSHLSALHPLHFLQGRLHISYWDFYSPRPHGKTTLCTVIRALWQFASNIWRIRNRKLHESSAREKEIALKGTLDTEIRATCTRLASQQIPYRSAPLGQSFTVDTKRSWLRWESLSQSPTLETPHDHRTSAPVLGNSNQRPSEIVNDPRHDHRTSINVLGNSNQRPSEILAHARV